VDSSGVHLNPPGIGRAHESTESMRALVSTIFPSHEIRMGRCMVLFEISASVTE